MLPGVRPSPGIKGAAPRVTQPHLLADRPRLQRGSRPSPALRAARWCAGHARRAGRGGLHRRRQPRPVGGARRGQGRRRRALPPRHPLPQLRPPDRHHDRLRPRPGRGRDRARRRPPGSAGTHPRPRREMARGLRHGLRAAAEPGGREPLQAGERRSILSRPQSPRLGGDPAQRRRLPADRPAGARTPSRPCASASASCAA